MNILINASSCKAGGGIQVADSICRQLINFPQHTFHVVLSEQLKYIHSVIDDFFNVKTYNYTMSNTVYRLLSGRDRFLDSIVRNENIDAVYIIFGPCVWRPRVPVVCGFAMSHLVLNDSPFWNTHSRMGLFKIKFRNMIQRWNFGILSDCYFTENEYISEKVKHLYPHKQIETITNNCHQIFDNPETWRRDIKLPDFDGLTLLTICANYPHKNLSVIPTVLKEIEDSNPNIKVRFVVTVNAQDLGQISEKEKEHIVFLGKVNIEQCPYLYEQCDVMFLPTMLECFSASYAEAMKMNKPILTSNLGFAHSLCGDAAMYFNPISPSDIAEKIINIATDKQLSELLVRNGQKQIKKFDSPSTRSKKIISLIESRAIR